MGTDKNKINILYLDDEENNLTSFKASFRREFKVFTTTSASEAVQILTENDIHVVISDQKMPNISGVEFFELIIPDFPDPIRMLLTGYADIEAVIDSINKGQVYRYISKPWNEQELRITINNAFELFDSKRQLQLKNQELEKAYNELEKLVYSASHDLRAPLVSILGILKLARAEGVDGAAKEYLAMIEKTVGKLDLFVQNLINYHQNMKNGQLLANVNFDLIFDEIITNYRHFDGANEVRFIKDIKADGDFNLDEMRLKMVLNNFISNAVKFRDRTKPDPFIKLNVETEADNIVITCEDNGIGIEKELIPRIYDMFYRITEDNNGSGIGLYIAKEAAERMGGSIEVESSIGSGSKFVIIIPKN